MSQMSEALDSVHLDTAQLATRNVEDRGIKVLNPTKREETVAYLNTLLKNESLPECIVVHGPCGVGKTFELDKMLKQSPHHYAKVHTMFDQAYGQGALFQYALIELSKSLGAEQKFESRMVRTEFISNLKTLLSNQSAVLVIEGAERFYPDTQDLLELFSKLQDLTDLNICTRPVH